MSLTVASLYVATLFNSLRHELPEVELGAFLDDRNVVTSNVKDLTKMLLATKRFDETAGHQTNLTKSTVFGNSQKRVKHSEKSRLTDSKFQSAPMLTWSGMK